MTENVENMSEMIRRLPLADTSFGEVSYPPGGMLGPRWQGYVQLVAVYAGSAAVRISGQATLTLQADDIGLLLPGREEHFTFAHDRPTHHSWCHLTRAKLSRRQVHALERLPSRLPLTDLMRRLLTAGIHASRDARPTAVHLRQAIGQALAAAYLDASEREPRHHAEHDPAVLRAQQYMESHFADRLDLEQIAEAAHVSASHLIRLFRQQVGVTPMQWLWAVRVQRGVSLLRHTGLSVAEVADRCGFQSPFHFSRRVRQQTGVSPRTLRQRQWRSPNER